MINFSKILNQVKLYLSNLSWQNCLTFLFFLLLAIIFWLFQISSEKINISRKIAISYDNINDSILFEEELPSEIKVNIKDYGSSLLNYFKLGDDTLNINFENIYSKEKSGYTIQGVELETLVKNKLLPSSELISINPSSLIFNYHKVYVKKVPVIFDGVVDIPIGYQLEGDITISPDSVMLVGAKAKLDSINFVYTNQNTITGVQSKKSIKETIIPIKGVNIKPNSIIVDIPIKEFIEKTITVPIECINLPDNRSIQLFPSKIKINYFVNIERSQTIDEKSFRVIANYEDIENNTNATSISILLINQPEFVRIKKIEPNEVEFIVEEKNE